MSLLAAASLPFILADIRQDAHGLMKVGYQAVDATNSSTQAVRSELSPQYKLAAEVTTASNAIRVKLSQLSSRVIELDDIEEGELNEALNFISNATLQFAGLVEYIQTELDINSDPQTDVVDRRVLDSIVRVRNDFEDLYVLLKQFKEDEPLESEALFSTREQVLAVSIKGLVALGLTYDEASGMVH